MGKTPDPTPTPILNLDNVLTAPGTRTELRDAERTSQSTTHSLASRGPYPR